MTRPARAATAEAALPDETIEDCERFCPVQSGCGADVAVADRSGFGELGDDVGEFLGGELEAGGWSERPAESVACAATLAPLFQESLVAQAMQYVAGGKGYAKVLGHPKPG
jgi:hypothetical protein